MKTRTTLVMFGVLSAVMAIGMVTATGVQPNSLVLASTSDSLAESPIGMYGHITFTTTDEAGTIKSYLQTDNIIVNMGENCVAELLFDVDTSGAEECDNSSGITTGAFGSSGDGFTFIEIGTDDTGSNDPSNLALIGPSTLGRTEDTTPDVTSAEDGTDDKPVVTVTGIFDNNSGSQIDVKESGIFDANSNGNMLARQTFGLIPLGDGDQLTVEWEITIGS